MRLKQTEIAKLSLALAPHLGEQTAKLYLFGSRLHDEKRGGDIDLLLVVTADQKAELLAKKGRVRSDLESAVDHQRVDLTIATEEDVKTDVFLMGIFGGAALITQIGGIGAAADRSKS